MDSRYCSACGTRLDPEAHARRRAEGRHVLFCDLIGSTAQAEQLDPEDVRALQRPYFARTHGDRAIRRHRREVHRRRGHGRLRCAGGA